MIEKHVSEALAEANAEAAEGQESLAQSALEEAKQLRVAALGSLREQTDKTYQELEEHLQAAQDAVEISKIKQRLMSSLRFERSKCDEIVADQCVQLCVPSEELALCSTMGQAGKIYSLVKRG